MIVEVERRCFPFQIQSRGCVSAQLHAGFHDSLVPIHICTSNLSRRIIRIYKDPHLLPWDFHVIYLN